MKYGYVRVSTLDQKTDRQLVGTQLHRTFTDYASGTRIDNHRNMARYYKLGIQPTLFGEWTFVREWERIGRAGTVRSEALRTRGMADVALIAKWSEKLRKGYRQYQAEKP